MRHRFLQVQENTETIFLPTGGLRAIRLFLQVPQSCLQPAFSRRVEELRGLKSAA
jgi:hypothetical protein